MRPQVAAWKAEQEGLLAAIKQAVKSGKPVKGKSVEDLKKELLTLELDKPEPPRVPNLGRGDDTPENLAYVLAHEWPSAGVITAEAGIVFGSHGMGTDSVMRNMAFLNTLWDGGRIPSGGAPLSCSSCGGTVDDGPASARSDTAEFFRSIQRVGTRHGFPCQVSGGVARIDTRLSFLHRTTERVAFADGLSSAHCRHSEHSGTD